MYRVWNAMNIGGVVTWNKARFRLVGTGVLVGGLGWGGGGIFPQIKLNHGLFSIPYKWFINIREISFLGICPRLHIFKSKNEKAPYRRRGDTRSHTLPPLGCYAPSRLVASLPRKDCAPKCFGSLCHCL